ncbi:MAG TPA: type II toxin-antitoxin system VapC family toxin [Terricaulis sp.]|jgi:Predicted nucleic-acid-binding protein, contains PIN domain|nr:type II toxin-antitoxin system VapC family toxin [Terricaulis sp.]
MIGLDTNVIVRYLAQDDPVQSPIATRLIERLRPDAPGYVAAIVLAEVTWVMARSYKQSREQLANIIEGLLRSSELMIEHAEAAYRALGRFRTSKSIDYADVLIAEISTLAGAREIVTFDKRAAADGGMRLLK